MERQAKIKMESFLNEEDFEAWKEGTGRTQLDQCFWRAQALMLEVLSQPKTTVIEHQAKIKVESSSFDPEEEVEGWSKDFRRTQLLSTFLASTSFHVKRVELAWKSGYRTSGINQNRSFLNEGKEIENWSEEFGKTYLLPTIQIVKRVELAKESGYRTLAKIKAVYF